MAIDIVTTFLDTATVVVWAYVYDSDDALTDPTGITLDIYDPDGTKQVDGSAMTKSATGIYYYYYHIGSGEDPMAEGRWRGIVTVVDGSGVLAKYTPQAFAFKVQ